MFDKRLFIHGIPSVLCVGPVTKFPNFSANELPSTRAVFVCNDDTELTWWLCVLWCVVWLQTLVRLRDVRLGVSQACRRVWFNSCTQSHIPGHLSVRCWCRRLLSALLQWIQTLCHWIFRPAYGQYSQYSVPLSHSWSGVGGTGHHPSPLQKAPRASWIALVVGVGPQPVSVNASSASTISVWINPAWCEYNRSSFDAFGGSTQAGFNVKTDEPLQASRQSSWARFGQLLV